LCANTAGTDTPLEPHDVPALTPAFSPLVLVQPVLGSILPCAIPYGRHRMVHFRAAAGSGQYATLVEPENSRAINSYRDRLVSNGRCKRQLIVARHILEAANLNLRLDGLARALSGAVGVGVLSGKAAVVDDVPEGFAHEASAAALVGIG
jgi:hypothetical protein